jgi:hypothetical protein
MVEPGSIFGYNERQIASRVNPIGQINCHHRSGNQHNRNQGNYPPAKSFILLHSGCKITGSDTHKKEKAANRRPFL